MRYIYNRPEDRKMAKTTMNLRVDSILKKNAEKVFSDLGLSVSACVVLFLKATIREKGLPFDVRVSNTAKIKKTKKPNKYFNVSKKGKKDFDLYGSTSIKNAINKL